MPLPAAILLLLGYLVPMTACCEMSESLVVGPYRATISAKTAGDTRTYELTTNAKLRDDNPPGKSVVYSEPPAHARIRTGSLLFDGLYALAVNEALQNSVSQIKDGAYNHGQPIPLEAFQTGAFWTYVWTRDISYSTHLALAGFDSQRAANSLLFKSSALKPSVAGGLTNQIVQDTGSGGSYPISSDRIVWALGIYEVLKFLPEPERANLLSRIYPILHDTLEQDRRLIFDPQDGLYRGEQSFLDWREQTYPGWTKDQVLAIGTSKALSMNVANYFALQTTAELAGRLGHLEEQARYATWAAALKTAINLRFFDPEAGLYSTYLLADVGAGIPVHRYDLLGESLAVLLEVANNEQATAITQNYPTGPYGTPVVWPQERTVPIYHNHSLWPFVTAYWTKAARKANNAAAVDQGIKSLMRGAALNLSNMENFDFASGGAWVKGERLTGPVINSQRQIWSVAGYLSMVQDVVFGLETSWDGIRFLPFITGALRNDTFASTNLLELRNFAYQSKIIQVRVHLPAANTKGNAACPIRKIEVNGHPISRGFVPAAALLPENQWDIYLDPPGEAVRQTIHMLASISDERSVFGPLPPRWQAVGQGGIVVDNGRLTLHYDHDDATNVLFNIYRDGQLCTKAITATQWTDPQSTNYAHQLYFYAIEAIDARTGNSSHLTPTHYYLGASQEWTIPAKLMENQGGRLVDSHHFEDWGRTDHQLLVKTFSAEQDGRYFVRAEFSNGAGPINTGITCAIKRLEIRQLASDTPVASGYLIMPQSGDWKRFDLSSSVPVNLNAGQTYSLRIFEDEYCHNMSYLAHNERYTALPGGGNDACNFVNISALHLVRLGP
jgi:hypothetical protein